MYMCLKLLGIFLKKKEKNKISVRILKETAKWAQRFFISYVKGNFLFLKSAFQFPKLQSVCQSQVPNSREN